MPKAIVVKLSSEAHLTVGQLFRFFVEDDRTAHREPESILQKQKNDRIEIEDFYTVVSRPTAWTLMTCSCGL